MLTNEAQSKSDVTAQIIYDTTFDLADPKAQQAMLNHCQYLENSSDVRHEFTNCFMLQFAAWITSTKATFPVPSDKFSVAVRHFLDQSNQHDRMVGFSADAKVVWVAVSVRTYVDKDLAVTGLETVFKKWEDIMEEWNQQSPTTFNKGYQFAYQYVAMSTQAAFISGTVKSILTSSALIGFAIILFTQNLWIMLFVMICIIATIVSLLGCFQLWGWPFGPVEALCCSLVTGLAVDYALHVGHAYNHSHENLLKEAVSSQVDTGLDHSDDTKVFATPGRKELTMNSLLSIGPSVVGAAATSIFSMIVLQFCAVNLFVQVGMVIATTLGMGVVYALVLFVAMLMCFGPLGDSGNIVSICRRLFRWFCGCWGDRRTGIGMHNQLDESIRASEMTAYDMGGSD